MQKLAYCECGNLKADNRSKRCIQCVRKNKKKYQCIDCGKKVKAQRKRCNDCDLKFRKEKFSGKNSPTWKHGKPKCKYCGIKLSGYKNVICKSCSGKHLSGEQNPRWKGGIKITYHGYRQIYAPDHPNSDAHGYIFEHRLVMSKHIDKPLRKDEVVHHIDGNRLNNNINNLRLLTKYTHHRECHNSTKKYAGFIKRLYEEGNSITTIGKIINRSTTTILYWLKKQNVKMRKKGWPRIKENNGDK